MPSTICGHFWGQLGVDRLLLPELENTMKNESIYHHYSFSEELMIGFFCW
jgi:hypothetical protein